MNLIQGPIMEISHSFWRDLWIAAFTFDQRNLITLLTIYVVAALVAMSIWDLSKYTVKGVAMKLKVNSRYVWTLLAVAVLSLMAASAGAQETITSRTIDMGALTTTTITTPDGIYTARTLDLGGGMTRTTISGLEGSGTATTMDLGVGMSRSTLNVNTWDDDDDDGTLKSLLFIETQRQVNEREPVDRYHLHTFMCDHD
jgi:hypothetical protein